MIGAGLARRLYARIPTTRRVPPGLMRWRGATWLQVNRLVGRRPVVVLRQPNGPLRLRITTDPVDEVIAESVVRRHQHQYRPDGLGVEPGEIVLDLGAHHGFYSVAAAHWYPGSTVIAVEPSEQACAVLRAQVDTNDLGGRVVVVHAALGDSCADAQLHHDPAGSWGHSLEADEHHVDGGHETTIVAPLTRLLEMAGCANASPALVKCNAEGGEFALVRQLGQLPWLPRVIVLMLHDGAGDVAATRAELIELGYRVDALTDDHHPVWHCRLEVEHP